MMKTIFLDLLYIIMQMLQIQGSGFLKYKSIFGITVKR